LLKSTGDPNDRYDTFWGPSNYSQVQKSPKLVNSPGAGIDVAAPGVSIYSCALNSGYTSMTGTSMATAHVTGLVALYIAANGRAHNLAEVLQIRQAIINASQPQSAWANTGASNDPDNNPEPLAVVSNSWIPVPTIQSLNRTSSATMLNFGIVPGFCYTVQSTDVLGDGQNWTDLQTANGSGGFRSITITNPTSNASQMYRLRRTIMP
jgi:subtilisin family serine protease